MAGRPSVAAEAKSQTEARKKELAEKLDKLNKQIKESPDDPMPCYRKAQCLDGHGPVRGRVSSGQGSHARIRHKPDNRFGLDAAGKH